MQIFCSAHCCSLLNHPKWPKILVPQKIHSFAMYIHHHRLSHNHCHQAVHIPFVTFAQNAWLAAHDYQPAALYTSVFPLIDPHSNPAIHCVVSPTSLLGVGVCPRCVAAPRATVLVLPPSVEAEPGCVSNESGHLSLI